MFVRLADQGEAAVPELLAIVRDRTLTPEKGREQVEHAVAVSFMILGPRAQTAIPAIEALILADKSLLFSDFDGLRSWNFALARMGKPIEEITFPGDSGPGLAHDRDELRRRLARFTSKGTWLN
jgi:hypothetical protein